MDVQDVLKALPDKPGCYLFKNSSGRVIYAGKARNLRNRVRSYFQKEAALTQKTMRLREQTASVEFITTQTEAEALLLEENLIKTHRPRYNVILKDDKHYPYLRLGKEGFPRLEIVRQRKKDGALYFGPYPGTGAVYETLRLMRRTFPLRTCSDHKFKTVDRPCLLYHIKRCPGPCVGLIPQADYQKIVMQAADFLDGKRDKVTREMEEEMEQAAEALEFERAARLRDRLRAVQKVTAEQSMVLSANTVADVFALYLGSDLAVVDVFLVRQGKVLGRKRYSFKVVLEEEKGAVMAAAIRTHYKKGEEFPPVVWVSDLPEDEDEVLGELRHMRGGAVTILRPQRGEGRRIMAIALENAREGFLLERGQEAEGEAAMDALADALSLPVPPRRIEGYDISNTQGTLSVASMVVFEGGFPRNAMYRRFNIRSVVGPDDFSSLQEAVKRRLGRLDDRRDSSFSRLPDLLLIDGGKGQVSAVAGALREIGSDVAMVGLAKRDEWLYLPGEAEPIVLPKTHLGLRLLQRVRDEAHRFANAGHAARRASAMKASGLDLISGIGPKRRQALMRAFGSLKKIRDASVEELVAAGLPRPLAERMKEGVNT